MSSSLRRMVIDPDRRDARTGFGVEDSAACWWTARPSRSTTGSRSARKSRTTLEVVVDRVRIEGDLRSRLTDSIETSYREGGGRIACRSGFGSGSGFEDGRRPGTDAGSCSPNASSAARAASRTRPAAAALLVQQPVRRLPDLSRVRQHHRARHGSGRAGPVDVDQSGRDRAVEQAALPGAAG